MSFGIELNDADLKQQIANSQRAFEQLASNVEAEGARMDGAIDSIADKLKQLGTTTGSFTDIQSAIQQTADKAESSGKSLDASMQTGANSATAMKQRLQELNQTLEDQKARVAEQRSYVQQSALALAEAKSAYEAVKEAKGEYAASLSQESEELNAVKKAHEEDTLILRGYNLEVSKTKAEIAETAAQLMKTGAGSSQTADAFQSIIDKMEAWKAKLQDVQVLNEKFTAQNASVQSLSQSITGLSQSSTVYSAKAQSLLGEINQLSAALRLAGNDLNAQEKAAAIDTIKQKITEYGQAVTQSSATAQTAFSLQQQVIQGLEQTIASLQAQMQAAAAAGNSEAVTAIQQQMNGLNKELTEAKSNLTSLQQQSQSAAQAMEGVASVQEKLSQGTTRGRSFFGDIIDEATLIKDKVSAAFESLSSSVSAKLEPIKAKFQEVGASVSTAFSNLSQKIGLDRLGEGLSSVGNKLGEYKQKVIDAATGHGKFQQSLGNMKTALNGLPMPLGNVITSIGGVTKALWSMCATPVGAVIGAIVVALRTLYTWFTKSAEGQKAFTALSAYFGSIMSSITDIVVIFGNYLYKAFANADGPMNAFTKGVVTTFRSAIKAVSKLVGGLGDTLKGIFTLDWDTFKDGMAEIGEGLNATVETALNGMSTAIKGAAGSIQLLYNAATDDKLSKDLGKAFNGMLDKASQAKNIATQELAANIALGKAKEKEAAMDITIAEEMNKIYQLTGKAKDEQIKKVKALKEEKYNDIISAQKQLYEAQQNRNKLHTVSLEDLKKEREQHISLLSTQAQRISSLRMLTRMEAMNERKMNNTAKSAASKGTTQANAETAAMSKENELIRRNTAARIKAIADMEAAVTDARINAMKDGEAKVIAERNREIQKELAQNEANKAAAIEAERKRQKEEFEASETVKKASSKSYKVQAWDDSMLDNSFIASIEEQYKEIAENIVQKANQIEFLAQAEAMRDYLKNYGTYQQQKLAIAEEYAQKIKEVNESSDNEATKAWKVKSLEAERDKAVQQTEIAAIKQRIDWGSVFGEFGAMFKEQLQPTIDSLKSIAQSKEFKSSSLEEQKTLYELINKLEQSNTVWDGDIFAKVSQDIMAYQSAMNNLVAAQEQERKATVALAEAKERLKKAEAEGNEVGTDIAKAEVARAEADLAQASDSVKLFGSQVERTSADMQTSSQQAVNQLQQLESGLSGLTSGSLKGLASALTSLDKLFGKGELEKSLAATLANSFQSLFGENSKASKALSEALGNSGMAGAIISAVLGIIDMIAQNGISGIITSIQDTTFGVVEGLLDDVLSGDIIMKPIENAAKHWYNIGNTLTFGALDSIFSGNGSEVESEINSLTRSNESLEDSINRLKDTMEKSIGTKAKEAYEEAMRQQQQVNDNKLKIAQRQASYWSAHHSWSSYWKGFTDDEKQEISKAIGKAFTGDVWDLSPEDMNKMLGYEWFTDKIRNTGYHYNGRSAYGESVLSALRDYGDQAGKLEELTDSFYESVTQISFDSMKDNFISNLMDMSKSAEDFSDDFAEYMQKAMLTNAMADIIEGDMKQLYDDWAKALEENGGTLSEEQIEEFNRRYDALVEKGIEKRDGIAKITGYTGEDSSSEGQSATTIASAGLTEDTGKAIEGRFTAMQITTEGIGSSIAAIQPDIHAISLSALAVQTDMKALGTTATAIMQNTAEMRNISLTAVDHLESIAKNTRELYTMNERLDKIEKNTRKI